ncbi:MAG TPA: universal stress protein [Burkholderiales bacterium]|nr:universal stress protein [Burkholderiales bacterium]
MFRRILVPTDGSPFSWRAVERAIRFAKEQDARVVGLWVGPTWQPNLYAYDGKVPAGFVSPKQFAARVASAAARHFAAMKTAAREARVPCKCSYVRGNFPFQEIVNAARRNRCDLIVMASHGRRGISRLLLGSEAWKVLAHSPVPVMICK